MLKFSKKQSFCFYLIFILSCLSIQLIQAQGTNSNEQSTPLTNSGAKVLRFQHLTSDDGLSVNTINAISQDHKGYIWIGTTAGLNRYDAYSIKHYFNDPAIADSLSNNTIRDLLVDKKGQLWVATEGGLNRYVESSDKFVVYRHSINDPASIISDNVRSLFKDSKGRIWIGTHTGISRYIPATDSFVHYKHESTDPINSMRPGIVKTFYEDSDGFIWIGTISGNNHSHRGLSRLNPETGHFTHFDHDPKNKGSLQKGSINGIVQTTDGKIWVIGFGGGLSEYLPESNTFRHISTVPSEQLNSSVSTPLTEKMRAALLDSRGNILITTSNAGLLLFDPNTETYLQYTQHVDNPSGLNSNRLQKMFISRDGLIWIGSSDGGVNILKPEVLGFGHIKPKVVLNKLVNSDLRAIELLPDGQVALGKYSEGLIIYNPDENDFIQKLNKTIDGFMSKGVTDVFVLDEQNILVASNEGIYSLNLINNEKHYFPIYINSKNGKTIKIFKIFQSRDGTYWLISKNTGMFNLNLETSVISTYPYADNSGNYSVNALSHYATTDILEDDKSILWISTTSGLNRYDRSKKIFKHYLHDPDNPDSIPDNRIHTLLIDSKKQFWLGTSGGLILFDKEEENFRRFSVTEGLSGNTIYCMAESGDYLWLGTNRGLTQFNKIDYSTIQYYKEDGLQSNEFNPRACQSGKNGQLVFAGVNGFNSFNVNDINQEYATYPVIISELKLDSEVISLTDNQIINLPYDNQVIQLEFRAMNYSSLKYGHYEMKMANFDKQWRNLGQKNNTIYTNMDHGKYIFKVRYVDRFGKQSQEAQIVFYKGIHPLLSMWAIVLYIILLLVIIYFYRASFKKQIAKEKDIASRERQLSVELRKLSGYLQDVREEEKARLARELHDELAQILVAVKLEVAWVESTLEREKNSTVLPRIPEINNVIESCMDTVRSISMRLRPSVLDDMGLIPAMRWYITEMSKRANIQSKFKTNCEDIQLSKDLTINIYRILQETITNAIKYAQSSKIQVSMLLEDEQLHLLIEDNGIGISKSDMKKTGHFGLIGIRERVANLNGNLTILSNKPSGVKIIVILPVSYP